MKINKNYPNESPFICKIFKIFVEKQSGKFVQLKFITIGRKIGILRREQFGAFLPTEREEKK